MISQGTLSVLFGCHSIIHSLMVIIAWKKHYKKIPEFWQIVCILIHDIGHWGKDYLDDAEEKNKHWILGAELARKLYGEKGYKFTAGHASSSGLPISEMRYPDKLSWVISPTIWLWSNNLVEPKLKRPGMTHWESAIHWKKVMKDLIDSGENFEKKSAHSIYLYDWGREENNKKG